VTRYKGLMLIGDGMADRPVPDLAGKTCLEAANTPNLDRAAAEGALGLLDTVAPGLRVGSDTAHLSLLGYDPRETYTGRGPLEAMGVGLEVKRGDIGFRCNFATVDDKMIVTDRRAGRIRERTNELAHAINQIGSLEGVQIIFRESTEHRGALILRGEGLSDKITDNVDPHEEGHPVGQCAPLDPNDKAANFTARVVNEFVRRSYQVLKDHPLNRERIGAGENPANIIIPRGAGVAPHLKPFHEVHGLSAACVVEVGLIRGLGRYLGFDVADAPGSTGSLDTDLDSIARTVLAALETHDFVLCNVKGPDIAGHNGDAPAKVKIIERIDAMVGGILPQLLDRTVLTVLADHATPVVTLDHTGDPVPFLLWGPGVLTDCSQAYHERAASGGGLGRFSGLHLVHVMTNLMNVQEKFGA